MASEVDFWINWGRNTLRMAVFNKSGWKRRGGTMDITNSDLLQNRRFIRTDNSVFHANAVGCCSLPVPAGYRAGCSYRGNILIDAESWHYQYPSPDHTASQRVLLRQKIETADTYPIRKMPWLAFRICSLPVPYPVMDSLLSQKPQSLS